MGQYSEDKRVDGILQAVAAFKKKAPRNGQTVIKSMYKKIK